MKSLLLSIALLLAGTPLSYADDEGEQYAACLIGQVALAMLGMDWAKPDAERVELAEKIAYTKCKEPKGLDDQGRESVSDFVYHSAAKLACNDCIKY